MRILAIDTSCDDSCVALIDTESRRLLADVVRSHAEPMKKFGGIVPEIASREHLKALPLATAEALEAAGLKFSDIDHFAVTNRPGLIGALLVGVAYTKALAFSLGKPFSVLNHLEGHLFSAGLAQAEGGIIPPYPWITLVVSGGHTELFLVRGDLDYQWLGGTLDDAAGEAFDKIGKLLGLPYPAGPLIDRWVREASSPDDRARFNFPRAKTEGLNFSFSGLKTAVHHQLRKLASPTESDRLAIAASAQEAILDLLVDRVRKAQTAHGVSQIVVTGGVACNSRLREKLADAFFPSPRHCTDNAAMIAWLAHLHSQSGTLLPAPWEASAQASIQFSC